MKTVKLFTHVILMSIVLAAVTACSGQKEGKASFKNRGSRAGVNAPTNVQTGAPITNTSNYGVLTGYQQPDVYNFLGGDSTSIGQVFSSGSTDNGVYLVGRLQYDSNGQLNPNSVVEIIVRDQGYQQNGGEFQSDFTNCTDSSFSSSQIFVTCTDKSGQLIINGNLNSRTLNQATLSGSITFTTEGFTGGSLGTFSMRASALMSVSAQ